jgi:hypothetical protein
MSSSSIKFRFNNAKDGDVVMFAGQSLQVVSLKRAIADRYNLSNLGPDGISVSDEQGNEYEDSSLVHKNSSVVVKVRSMRQTAVFAADAAGPGASDVAEQPQPLSAPPSAWPQQVLV